MTTLATGVNTVTFTSNGDRLTGDLYLPEGFDPSATYPTVIFTRPVSQVRQQAAAVHGPKWAERGYVFLAFDPKGFGDSEGEPRNYDHAPSIIANTHDAISYLLTLDFVDTERFYGAGLCMGGAYMTYATFMDRRIKAFTTIVAYLNCTDFLFTMFGEEGGTQAIEALSDVRQGAYATGDLPYVDLFGGLADNPSMAEGNPVLQETFDYYLTPRAGAMTNPNYSNLIPALQLAVDPTLNPVPLARHATTPYLAITGSNAYTAGMTHEFHDAYAGPKQLLVIDDAPHVDLYDNAVHVDQAVDEAHLFFTTSQGHAS